eukprot:s207_g22.t1
MARFKVFQESLLLKELLTSGQKPQARGQHCAVITESGTMVVYGGAHASSTLHDVWALDVRKTPAVWVEAGHEAHCSTLQETLAEYCSIHQHTGSLCIPLFIHT